jgi:hypothetical protein
MLIKAYNFDYYVYTVDCRRTCHSTRYQAGLGTTILFQQMGTNLAHHHPRSMTEAYEVKILLSTEVSCEKPADAKYLKLGRAPRVSGRHASGHVRA